MRYAFIHVQRGLFPLEVLCRLMEVSQRGYYEWRGRGLSERASENKNLKEQIEVFHCGSRMTYGYRRIHADLRAAGHKVNKKRVARLMRQQGLQGIKKGKFKVVTTNSNHDRSVLQNHLEQNFTAIEPNQKWAADLSYIPTLEGWLFIAVILDLFSRKVVGWAFSAKMSDDLCLKALQMALLNRQAQLKTQVPNHLIHHSDQGSQYARVAALRLWRTPLRPSYDYRDMLDKNHLTQSMSRKGNCYDNAVVESFFATLKTEEVYQNQYLTHQQAQSSIFSYIEGFYNRTRRHSTLGNRSPLDFENQYWQNYSRVA